MNAWKSEYKSHQGNLGLGRAIAYYTSNCIPVLIPLNDTQKYDIAIDKNGLKRVSIKTTQHLTKSNHYEVLLKNCGGASGQSKIRYFDNSTCDILFILTIKGDMYEIPSNEIMSKSTLTLTDKWDKYKVFL